MLCILAEMVPEKIQPELHRSLFFLMEKDFALFLQLFSG